MKCKKYKGKANGAATGFDNIIQNRLPHYISGFQPNIPSAYPRDVASITSKMNFLISLKGFPAMESHCAVES